MLNLLYCIDENYNKQAYISIASILEKTSQEINIFMIHIPKLPLKYPPL